MKMIYERDRVDNKFKDLEYGELFRFVNKFPDRVFMKCVYPLRTPEDGVSIAINVDNGMPIYLIDDYEEIVRVDGVLTIK